MLAAVATLAVVMMLAAIMVVATGSSAAFAQVGEGDRAYRVFIEHAEEGITHLEDWRLLARADGSVAAVAIEEIDNQMAETVRFFRVIAQLDGSHDGVNFQAQGSVIGMVTLWAAEDSPEGVRLVECPIVDAAVQWEGTFDDNEAVFIHRATWDYRCVGDVGSAALDPADAAFDIVLLRTDALPDDAFAFTPAAPTGIPSPDQPVPDETPADAGTGAPATPPGGFGTGLAGGTTADATDLTAADAGAPAGGATVLFALAGMMAAALMAAGIVIALRLARGGTSVALAAGTASGERRSGSLLRVGLLLAALGAWTLMVGAVVALAGGAAAFAHYLAMLAFVVFIGATVSTARAFRRTRSMSQRALMFMALLPLAMALLQIGLNSQGRALAALVGLPVGIAAGIVWALLTKVQTDDQGLQVAGTIPALIVWALVIGLAQIVRLVGSDVPGLLLAIVVAQSTAFGAWALMVLRRGKRARSGAATPPGPAPPAFVGAPPPGATGVGTSDVETSGGGTSTKEPG